MRVALRIGYDGTRFQGSQRQPDARTVEGDLLAALRAVRAVPPEGDGALESAGRTDAGVSAAGNVVAVDVDFREAELVRALNARLDDAWVVARARVPDGWSPRRAARSRSYAYVAHVPAGADPGLAARAMELFEGAHDFSSFARLEPHRDPVRRVEWSRLASVRGGVWTFVVRGESFLWNQVRRMVGAALAVARGEAALDDVRAALGGRRAELGLAPAEGLVLTGVEYGEEVAWTCEAEDTRRLAAALRERVGAARVAERRERALLAGVEPFE